MVEDEEAARFLGREVFRRAGVTDHFVALSNGRDAVEYLEETLRGEGDHPLPDIILLDLYMPVMGGLEFLDVFYAKFRTRIRCNIFLLVHDKANTYMFRNWGSLISGYVDKPLTIDKVKGIVENKVGNNSVTPR